MKHILKRGPVRVYVVANRETYLVIAEESASERDYLQAVDDEEELNLYRELAGRN